MLWYQYLVESWPTIQPYIRPTLFIIGDSTGETVKVIKGVTAIVFSTYSYHYRMVKLRPKRKQMRAQYPDIRLDINGNFVSKSKAVVYERSSRLH